MPFNRALRAENIQYIKGQGSQPGTRLGFSQAYNASDAMTSMFNWISSLGNLLLWYRSSDNSVQFIDIDSPIASTVITGDLLGYGATFAEAGARLYCSFFTASGLGASGCRVVTLQSSVFVNDLAFQPPLTYVPGAPTEPGAGTITGGTHYFAYRVEYRSGFLTRPSPDTGVGSPSVSTFTPVQFTAAGSKNLSWVLNTAWPEGAVNVVMLMTTVANPAQWFEVPGAVQPVVGGTTSTITFTIDISDDILFATGIDATASLFFLTNTVANVPAFTPSVVLTHGTRMVYVTTVSDNVGNQAGALYVSAISAYQEITADQSLIQLPGLKDIVTAISLDGTLYMFGPQWTYRTIDNGAAPVTWPAPILVDGRRGTLAVRGAEVSPSGTYAWLASQDGLYYFQGSFPPLPISYYQQPDWNRINWSAAETLEIRDDPSVKIVYVLVPLDGSSTPTHLMKWDYTNGFEPGTVQYSLDNVRNYPLGAMEVVQNTLTGQQANNAKLKELWIGSSSANPILRRNSTTDITPYRDNSQPISTLYETALFPRRGGRYGAQGEVLQHHGADYRMKGFGVLNIITWAIDHARSYNLLPVQLAPLPGQYPHRSFDLISEGVSHQFGQGGNSVLDPNFDITP